MKHNEHFGMAVAEYVAGGMIPFLPESGGQVKIVERHDALCYESNSHCVELILELLNSPEQAMHILSELPDIRSHFGADGFNMTMREEVRKKL